MTKVSLLLRFITLTPVSIAAWCGGPLSRPQWACNFFRGLKMPSRIPIRTAQAVAEMHDLTQVLLIGWDGERVHVVTYGKTKADCAAAAKAQDFWTGKIREFSFKGADDAQT